MKKSRVGVKRRKCKSVIPVINKKKCVVCGGKAFMVVECLFFCKDCHVSLMKYRGYFSDVKDFVERFKCGNCGSRKGLYLSTSGFVCNICKWREKK